MLHRGRVCAGVCRQEDSVREEVRGLKVVKVFPSPHVEMRVSVSGQMEADLKDCYKRACAGEAGECEGCSWFGLQICETGLCDFRELTDKVLGMDRKEV